MSESNKKGCLYYIMWAFLIRIGAPFLILILFTIITGISDFVSGIWSDDINKISSVERPKKTPSTEQIFSKNAYWTDNYAKPHALTYKIKGTDYSSSLTTRANSSPYIWNTMAKKVINNDKLKLNSVYNEFNKIRRNGNYSRQRFADIIVSFVQDIPYSIIYNTQDIYAPVEFLKKYKGDCDTRTILLYIVLQKFDYDAVILNNYSQAHSVIGINLPTSGNKYKYYNGRRYYTWETTYPGWKRGLIPPEFTNMYLWEVANLK